jgi:hypothetical protein
MKRVEPLAKNMTNKSEIERSIRGLMAFLERNKQDAIFEFPFSYSYPRNCCESVSLILTYLLEEKYGLRNVVVMKGTKPRKHEHHFWIRVGDFHYDLTAHQFPRRRPIVGVLAHSLFFSFAEWEVEHGRDFVERDAVIALYRAGAIPF